jgi:hypothetical protein
MNPDYHIEQFWISFKTSMNNFYNTSKCSPRPINYWSEYLNKLQKNIVDNDYNNIEINIRDYMSLYAIDLLRNNSEYHIGILNTNIKRWNIISTSRFEFCDSKYINIVFLLLDIYDLLIKCEQKHEIEILFSMVEIYIIHEDLKTFIDYAIKYNKPSIIDKILKFEEDHNKNSIKTPGIKYIENIYNVELSPKMSAKKIFNKINHSFKI